MDEGGGEYDEIYDFITGFRGFGVSDDLAKGCKFINGESDKIKWKA